jgi:hypothetical protein
VDEPDVITEADERHARRAGRWIRFAFYPAAAVLAAVLLLGRDHAAGAPVTTKYGATTQGRVFKLGLDKQGRVAAFDTELVALCPNGHTITMPWSPAEREGVHFRRDGDDLRVTERGEGWEQELDASTEGGGLSGTMKLVVHVTPKTRAAFDCVSKHLRFSVRG